MRVIWAAIALAALATPIDAAPLCRDSKGLFTPCTGERRPSERTHRQRSAVVAGMAAGPGSPASADSADATSVKPGRPPRVGRGKLCRDSKGLFKPC